MKFRTFWRRTWMGSATVTGLGRFGFFIPYRYASEIPPAQDIHYQALEDEFTAAKSAQMEFLKILNEHAEVYEKIGKIPPPAPRWLQVWFPRLDGAVAYAMVVRHRPTRIVEVGSGHSTRFLAKAVMDADLNCRITSIDPAPRADISSLKAVHLLQCQLAKAKRTVFSELAPGDVLFIDSSHILMPGSDVDFLLNEILPTLPTGVLVHVHDVFLPDSYPPEWSWRGYNEQQGVAALIHGGRYEIMFSSHYAQTRLRDTVADTVIGHLPIPVGAVESSLWLRKRS